MGGKVRVSGPIGDRDSTISTAVPPLDSNVNVPFSESIVLLQDKAARPDPRGDTS